MNIFHEPFLNYLVEKGIPLYVETGLIYLPGFYKHDRVVLDIDKQQVCIIDRYIQTNLIGDKRDTNEDLFWSLVGYNHEVWIEYKDHGYEEPNGIWLPHMLEFGLVKERVVYE